jgi:hypothetical protein
MDISGDAADSIPEYLKTLEAIIRQTCDVSGDIDIGPVSTTGAVSASDILDVNKTSVTMLPTLETTLLTTPTAPVSVSAAPVAAAPIAVAPQEPTTKQKVKFLLVSTHIHQFTGYSKVSQGILTELARHPWIQTTHFGFQKMADVPPGFRPYPPSGEAPTTGLRLHGPT